MLSSLKSTLLKLNSVANQNQHLETSKTWYKSQLILFKKKLNNINMINKSFQESNCTLKQIQNSLVIFNLKFINSCLRILL